MTGLPVLPDKTIVLHPADSGGCGHYRLRQPAKLLAFNHVAQVKEASFFLKDEHIAELNPYKFVTQRQTELDQCRELRRYKSSFPNIPVQMDLDDLLWQVPPGNGYHKRFSKNNRKAIFENIRYVDIMTASTVPLALEIEKIRRGKVHVYPNLVSSHFFIPPRPRTRGKLRVGWAGSATHEGDLSQIKSVVMHTLDMVDWVFMGYCPEWAKGLVEFHPGVVVEEYMKYLPKLNLDVAVAPLEHNLFNECKSNLKLLEFSAIGVPVITTDIYPYSENPGFKIKDKNSFKKWMEAIDVYIRDESLRFNHAVASYNWALSTYKLESNLETIEKLWLSK